MIVPTPSHRHQVPGAGSLSHAVRRSSEATDAQQPKARSSVADSDPRTRQKPDARASRQQHGIGPQWSNVQDQSEKRRTTVANSLSVARAQGRWAEKVPQPGEGLMERRSRGAAEPSSSGLGLGYGLFQPGGPSPVCPQPETGSGGPAVKC